PAFDPTTLVVKCYLPDHVSIDHAEFRIAGAENHPNWAVGVNAPPGGTAAGDPFGAGMTVDLPPCDGEVTGPALLALITVIPLAAVPQGYWRLAAPTHSPLGCASVRVCGPTPTNGEARTFVSYPNTCESVDRPEIYSTCDVSGVQSQSWGHVK